MIDLLCQHGLLHMVSDCALNPLAELDSVFDHLLYPLYLQHRFWPGALSKQIGLSWGVAFHSLRCCEIPSAVSTISPPSPR